MVSVIRYLFLLSLVVLTACGKNEFNLDFRLEKDVTENYNVNYYASAKNGGRTIQAVASVREGNCELKGFTQQPTLLYITKRNSVLPLVIYAEKNNKIEISGEGKEPLDWDVKGNEINEILSAWRLDNKEIMSECVPDSVNNAVERFVEENPESQVSTILMLCYFDRKVNERKYTELMGMLKGEAKNTEWLRIIGRSDQLIHSYSYPARLESMVMRSAKKGGDTLIIDKKNPVLLLFWESGNSDRKVMIDSIKALEKEFPDSSRIIADVCLDIDSIGWKNTMKKDSLYKDMKRFWAPAGLNETRMQKLKVAAIPYYIVFTKEGVQSYRGTDLSDAINEYRTLFNSSDSTLNQSP
ncbi:MAG: hypothetical protein J1E16_02675 [Muribaculaceae bacterium]|nr:hypothetical protein [Muribaculaceae bacterium]